MAIKQNNFYQRWNEAAKADKTAARSSLMRKLLLPALIVLVLVVAWGVVFGYTAMLHRRTTAITNWCSDPLNNEPYMASITNQTLAATYRSEAASAQNVWDLLGTYPDVTSSTLARVQAAGREGITIVFRSYNSATGQFLFDAQSSQVIDIPTYIRSLQSTGLFQRVDYTGYGFNSSGTYTINFVCTLAAPEEGGQT